MGFGHDENEVGLVGGFGCEGLALVAGKVGAEFAGDDAGFEGGG